MQGNPAPPREPVHRPVDVSPMKHTLGGWEQGIGRHLLQTALALGERLPPRRDRHACAPYPLRSPLPGAAKRGPSLTGGTQGVKDGWGSAASTLHVDRKSVV